MELIEAIQSAKALLARSTSWSTGSDARNRAGRPVPYASREAVTWSVEGALRHCAGPDYQRILWREFRTLVAGRIGRHRNLFDWEENPRRTHREVVLLLADAEDALKWA